MKHLIFLFVLLEAPMFFCLTAILGIEYSGGGSNTLYRNYCIFCFALALMAFVLDTSQIITQIRQLLSIVIITLYILVGLFSGWSEDSSWLCLVAFCLPATLIGMYYARTKSFYKIVRWIDVFVLIISVALVFLIAKLNLAIVAGTSYYSQSLSYYAALAFLLNLYMLRYGDQYHRFAFFSSTLYRNISYIWLPFYVLTIMMAGGRGGFVTLLIGVLVFLFSQEENRRKILGYAIGFILISILVGAVFMRNADSSLLSMYEHNSERVFSYISNEGIDMGETSGRDFVFARSWNLIWERPLSGYGLFSYKDTFIPYVHQPYPHNLFLEWILQGGFLFCLMGIVFLYQMFRKFRRLLLRDRVYMFLVPFTIYPFTMLMYTGSYMEDPFFWFVMVFLFNLSPVKTYSGRGFSGRK